MSSSHNTVPVDIETGIAVAVQVMGKIPGPSALAGGMAMRMHGFIRNTSDVDILATQLPPMRATKPLSFGGSIFELSAKEKGPRIVVDVIVRADEKQELYNMAINAAQKVNGIRTVTPVYMAVLKYFAGRTKDRLDLHFLLLNKLFSTQKAAAIIRKAFPGNGGRSMAGEFIKDMETELFIAERESKK